MRPFELWPCSSGVRGGGARYAQAAGARASRAGRSASSAGAQAASAGVQGAGARRDVDLRVPRGAGAHGGLGLGLGLRRPARVHTLVQISDAAARATAGGAWLGLGVPPSGLGVPNAHNGPCPQPAACPTPRRTAGSARSRRLRWVRSATRRPGGAGRCRAAQGCPETHPGGLGVPNARDTPCPKPAACPVQRRTAGPAPPHRLRPVRSATREPGSAGRYWPMVQAQRVG